MNTKLYVSRLVLLLPAVFLVETGSRTGQNSKMDSKADKSDIADKNQYVLSYNADDWKLLFAVEKGIFYVRVVNINTGSLVYGGKITLTAFE